jgi:hypothetical protein
MAVTLVVVAGLAAAAWVGYQAYLEHTHNAEIEHQIGVEEQARRNAEMSTVEVIDELEQTPAFNGPGAPDLGLAPDTTQP